MASVPFLFTSPGVAVAGLSDWLDGYIAREYQQHSILGTYLDPLADKVLVGCVAIPLFVQGVLPTWLIALIMTRDVSLVVVSAVSAYGEIVRSKSPQPLPEVRPTQISKVNTALQITLLCSSLSMMGVGFPDPIVHEYLCYSVGASTLVSGLDYLSEYLKKRCEVKK